MIILITIIVSLFMILYHYIKLVKDDEKFIKEQSDFINKLLFQQCENLKKYTETINFYNIKLRDKSKLPEKEVKNV